MSKEEKSGLLAVSPSDKSRWQRKERLFNYSSFDATKNKPSEKKSVTFQSTQYATLPSDINDRQAFTSIPISSSSQRSSNSKKSSSSTRPTEMTYQRRAQHIIRILSRCCQRIPCSSSTLAFIAFAVLIVIACYLSYTMSRRAMESCLGAPYLYVTHRGAKNVMKFSRNGCLLSSRVLWGNYDQSDLRGLVLGNRNNVPALYVADSSSKSSQILVFGSCSSYSSMRRMTGRVTSENINPGVLHPYSIALDDQQNIYASFQDTDVVLRFAKDTFTPLESPPLVSATNKLLKKISKSHKKSNTDDNSSNISGDSDGQDTTVDAVDNLQVGLPLSYINSNSSDSSSSFHPGTFVQFGQVGFHNHDEQGVRGVAFVRGVEIHAPSAPNASLSQLRRHEHPVDKIHRHLLTRQARPATVWVANKDLNAVCVFDAMNGNLTAMLPLGNPIGLHVDYQHNLMFAGSKKSKAAAVVAYDLDTFAVVRKYTLLSMKHPTGIVSYGGELLVADQEANAIWSFNITSGRYLRLVVSSEKLTELRVAELEVMALSDC